MVQDTPQFVAKILLEAGCVSVNVKQPFRYSSGILSPIYCDNRLLVSDLQKRRKIIDLWAEMLKSKKLPFKMIAGTAIAGIPHAAWLSDRLDVPMVYIRDEQKGHGKRNKIEGALKKGANVLVVDDLFSTGGSVISAAEAIRAEGGIVTDVSAIFSYELPTAKENFRQAKITVHSLSTFSTLIKIAVDEQRLSKDDAQAALEWAHDPQTWGESHASP